MAQEHYPQYSTSQIDEKGYKFCMNKPKNVSSGELRKLTPLQRSRYLAYMEPPKNVTDALRHTSRRLQTARRNNERGMKSSLEDQIEMAKHAILIGQLKAAEARNRLRIMRLRYQANRAQEIGHLIACQPEALQAVRLQAFLPPSPDKAVKERQLDKPDMVRVRALIEDTSGLLTRRTS